MIIDKVFFQKKCTTMYSQGKKNVTKMLKCSPGEIGGFQNFLPICEFSPNFGQIIPKLWTYSKLPKLSPDGINEKVTNFLP